MDVANERIPRKKLKNAIERRITEKAESEVAVVDSALVVGTMRA
jgi:hypothetical protein